MKTLTVSASRKYDITVTTGFGAIKSVTDKLSEAKKIAVITDDAVKEDSFEEKKTQYISQLSSELSISPAKAEILVNNGYLTVEGLRSAGISDIAAIKGMDEETVNAISEGLAKINQTSDGASDGEQQ